MRGSLRASESEFTLRNGTLEVESGLHLCNGSTLYIAGVNATLRLRNEGVTLCNNSRIVIESGASLDLSDSLILTTEQVCQCQELICFLCAKN